MSQEEKTNRTQILEKLNISDDVLTLYEKELEIFDKSTGTKTVEFSDEEIATIELLHRLRESGLSYNEVILLSSFGNILNRLETHETSELKNLVKLSPVYRLKQILTSSKSEVKNLKSKVQEVEESFNNLLMEKKEEIIILENKLSEALKNKSTLESTIHALKKEQDLKHKHIQEIEQQISQISNEYEAKLKTKETEYFRELEGKEEKVLTLENKLTEALSEKSILESNFSGIKGEYEAKQIYYQEIEQKISQLSSELEIKQNAILDLDKKLATALSEKSKFESQLAPTKAQLDAKQQAFDSLDKQFSEVLLQKSSIESQLASTRVESDVAQNSACELQEYSSKLKAELEVKQKSIENLDRELSEALMQRSQLEVELQAHKEGKFAPKDVKGKRSKELYQILIQKQVELSEATKKNDELIDRLKYAENTSRNIAQQFQIMEETLKGLEEEIENKYKEQIAGLKVQIETLVDKKQKEWEEYHLKMSDQHRKELTTLQRKHQQETSMLKRKLEERTAELEEIKMSKNPLSGILIGAKKLQERIRS